MFAAADLTEDGFLGGRLRILQPREGYRAATDPVLLAAACPARPGDSVLDLGCGAGVAGLCLALRVPGVVITGLEVQPDYAALAVQNAARNGLAMEVVPGDVAAPPAVLRRPFDHVICNPPYHPASGSPSPRAGRDTANRIATPIATWVETAARRLAPGGWLTLILSTSALPEALAALTPRLGSVAMLPLAPRAGKPAPRIILRARKDGRAALRLLSPLILHEGDAHADGDHFTPAVRAALRDGADLLAAFG